MNNFEFDAGSEGIADRRPEDLIKEVLAETSDRDREILARFYLKEQSPARICSEMEVSEEHLLSVKSKARARFSGLREKTRAARSS